MAGEPGGSARGSAHVDPPVSLSPSEKREHPSTPGTTRKSREKAAKRGRKEGPTRTLALPEPEPPLSGEPHCDDQEFQDRMRAFHPDAEMQQAPPDAASVPVPEGDDSDLLCDGRVNGEDNAHAAYAANLFMEGASSHK